MKFYRVVVLFCIFLVYLLLGGLIFKALSEEQVDVTENPILKALDHFQISLLDENTLRNAGFHSINYTSLVVTQFNEFSSQYIKQNISNGDWSFYEAIFFSLTVITTIGYGNRTMKTPSGRGICILYALIGIPITALWMAGVGSLFRKKLIHTFEKYKKQNQNSKSSGFHLIIKIISVLIPGCVLFIIFPATMFMALEDWGFLDSLYYSIITLTTIGFGDFVAGEAGTTQLNWIYKSFIMIWICFGLGYISMILNFIGKGMKSKKIKKLDEMFINNLKTTQFSFTKEIDYIIKGINKFNSKSVQESRVETSKCDSCSSLDKLKSRAEVHRSESVESAEIINDSPCNIHETSSYVFNMAVTLASEETSAKCPNKPEHNGKLLAISLLPHLRVNHQLSSGLQTPASVRSLSFKTSSVPLNEGQFLKPFPYSSKNQVKRCLSLDD